MSNITNFKKSHQNAFYAIIAVIVILILLGVKNVITSGNVFSASEAPTSLIKQSIKDHTLWKVTYKDEDNESATIYFYLDSDEAHYKDDEYHIAMVSNSTDYKLTDDSFSLSSLKFTDLETNGKNIDATLGNQRVTIKNTGDKISED